MVAVAIIDMDAKKHKRGNREQDEGEDDEDDSVEKDNVGLGSAARNKDLFGA
ncbi:unnamed protein product [Dibothriocephalus latus]|uniref:Uncharacterized protein n=1 Tax=Dibothriocephalus latus TaxID=60516 RepID=A0A3P6RUR9_DIBLA|nr:unnamed protein product [Dibothriocephalus latus]